MKWLFNCNDNTVRFSVVFTTSQTRESVVVEEEHRVKGDGRYDLYDWRCFIMYRGEYQCSEPGVLTLIWDNTYSLLSSRDISLRIAVKRKIWEEDELSVDPKQETHPVEEVKEEMKEEVKEEVKQTEPIQQHEETIPQAVESEISNLQPEEIQATEEGKENLTEVVELPEDVMENITMYSISLNKQQIFSHPQ